MLIERVVIWDREVEAIEWTPPARPFFEAKTAGVPPRGLAGPPAVRSGCARVVRGVKSGRSSGSGGLSAARMNVVQGDPTAGADAHSAEIGTAATRSASA
jgi:hypothetical protein